jgi:hypothetical protein
MDLKQAHKHAVLVACKVWPMSEDEPVHHTHTASAQTLIAHALCHAGKFPSLSEDEPAYHGVNFSKACGPAAFTYFNIAVGLRDLGYVCVFVCV